MKVSKDRSTWESLGDWYDASRSIFAMNSDVFKFNDTYKTIGGSGYRKKTNNQLPESRVVNVSGLILADDIETVRLREREIRSSLIGAELYFLDEFYNMVLFGSVPNINSTPGRGELNGRSSLINFNINNLDPYWTTLARISYTFSSLAYLEINYDTLYAVNTNYTIKFTCKSANTIVTELVPSLIKFHSSKTIGYGDVLTFSTENSSYVATWKVGGSTTNILSSMTDDFFIHQLVLTPGLNGITINSAIEDYFNVEVSFYGRSL
jgi:hypothetical protein